MIIELLKDIEKIDYRDYHEILFNLYEDEHEYTIEVVFDDDELIIGRDDKIYIVADNSIHFEEVLHSAGNILKTYFKSKKDLFKQFKTIAYGFVDGDLYYIKRISKTKKEQTIFSKEDFFSFDAVKLKAWLTVYLNDEGKKKYGMKVFTTDFNKVPTEEFEEWCDIRDRYFNYKKYNK